MNDVYTNYIRFYRTHSYYRVTENMLKALVWTPETCQTSADCVGGNVDGRRCKHGRCVLPEVVEGPSGGGNGPEGGESLADQSDAVTYFCAQPGAYVDPADGSCWHMGEEGQSCAEVCKDVGSTPAASYVPNKHRHMTTIQGPDGKSGTGKC
eukprot:g1555.t1